jgi:hypothetical protein
MICNRPDFISGCIISSFLSERVPNVLREMHVTHLKKLVNPYSYKDGKLFRPRMENSFVRAVINTLASPFAIENFTDNGVRRKLLPEADASELIGLLFNAKTTGKDLKI